MKAAILIFESNKKAQTDYKYVKSVFKQLYNLQKIHIKPIFAGSKCNEYSINTRNKIRNEIKKFPPNTDVSIIFFADVDQGTNEDVKRNKEIVAFANSFSYKNYIVWFNKDVEEVFLGKIVSDKVKTKEADKFYEKSANYHVDKRLFMCADPLNNNRRGSNLLIVSDEVFEKLKTEF